MTVQTMMTNQQAQAHLHGCHGAKVTEMYWIAIGAGNDYLEELLEHMQVEHWATLFPRIRPDEVKQRQEDFTCFEGLMEHGYLGFIAYVAIPTNFRFKFDDKGEFISCEESQALMCIKFLYAETLDDLLAQIERIAQTQFAREMDKARIDRGITAPA